MYPQKRTEIKLKKEIYILYNIPNKIDILAYLKDIHIEDLHRGISSLRNILKDKLIFLEGSTNITKYIVNSCIKCSEKNKYVLKREPSWQIITYYPRQRYVIELTELSEEFYENKAKIYLFDLIDHFSKFGMSYIIKNKSANTIFNYLKIALKCNGYPTEICSDNGLEFKNLTIENYLNDNNIKF